MSFTEDKSVFFSTGDFADAVTYNSATTVNGIFEHRYVDTFQVGSRVPTFLCDKADIPSPAQGQTVVHNGTTYQIAEPMPDPPGLPGMLMLILKVA